YQLRGGCRRHGEGPDDRFEGLVSIIGARETFGEGASEGHRHRVGRARSPFRWGQIETQFVTAGRERKRGLRLDFSGLAVAAVHIQVETVAGHHVIKHATTERQTYKVDGSAGDVPLGKPGEVRLT